MKRMGKLLKTSDSKQSLPRKCSCLRGLKHKQRISSCAPLVLARLCLIIGLSCLVAFLLFLLINT